MPREIAVDKDVLIRSLGIAEGSGACTNLSTLWSTVATIYNSTPGVVPITRAVAAARAKKWNLEIKTSVAVEEEEPEDDDEEDYVPESVREARAAYAINTQKLDDVLETEDVIPPSTIYKPNKTRPQVDQVARVFSSQTAIPLLRIHTPAGKPHHDLKNFDEESIQHWCDRCQEAGATQGLSYTGAALVYWARHHFNPDDITFAFTRDVIRTYLPEAERSRPE